MKAASVLTIVAMDTARSAEVAARLHIPHFSTCAAVADLPTEASTAEECRMIATFFSENGTKFSILSVTPDALFYPPTALMLSARTTLCVLGEFPFGPADIRLPEAATVDQIVGAWLSSELLSSFQGTK